VGVVNCEGVIYLTSMKQECPRCQANNRQWKIGLTAARCQRYECGNCGCRYVPEPKTAGCPETVRQQAVKLYLDEMDYRRIGRQLEADHVTVMNWVRDQACLTPDLPVERITDSVLEMDELFTHVAPKRDKKTPST
jgi:transposase